MKITVDLPPNLVWQLSEKAEATGVRESDLVAGLVENAFRSVGGGSVETLWRAGLTDGEISVQTGLVRNTVACQRRRLGLAPNKTIAAGPRKAGK